MVQSRAREGNHTQQELTKLSFYFISRKRWEIKYKVKFFRASCRIEHANRTQLENIAYSFPASIWIALVNCHRAEYFGSFLDTPTHRAEYTSISLTRPLKSTREVFNYMLALQIEWFYCSIVLQIYSNSFLFCIATTCFFFFFPFFFFNGNNLHFCCDWPLTMATNNHHKYREQLDISFSFAFDSYYLGFSEFFIVSTFVEIWIKNDWKICVCVMCVFNLLVDSVIFKWFPNFEL